jgi:hypothetical protein
MASRKKTQDAADPFATTERVMQTFRMPRELVAFLRDEATGAGRDLTPHVNRYLDGIRTWFALPEAATRLLEEDRAAMKLDRYEYILHLLFMRSLELREKGPGFEAPGKDRKR